MTEKSPFISCICVTRGKPAMLKRAVECFSDQSWPAKELVIVFEDDDPGTIDLIEKDNMELRSDIRLIRVGINPKISLGELRNMGISAAKGEFICQWDDDDWYHVDRLKDQYHALARHDRDGSIMSQWLVFDSLCRKAYISNKRAWEGSILCRKTTLQHKGYEDKSIDEDGEIILDLVAKNCLHLLHDIPKLYIYVYHGRNTWDREHWNYIFECSTALSEEDSLTVSDILDGKYPNLSGSLLLDEIIEKQYAGIPGK